MSLLLAVAAAATAQASVAAPHGLSLREAQTLPASAVLARVLGAVGVLYPEIGRPSPAITRGRAFQISFASTPRAAGFPGVCVADAVTVDFGPAGDGPATATARVQSEHRGTVYRIVGDTSPPLASGMEESDIRALAAQCAAAGPVLAQPGMIPRFFSGNDLTRVSFWASHAYFGARALAKASAAAPSQIECRDDIPGPGDRVCDDPSALLRNLQMDRFLGFTIERCNQYDAELCVTANFSRGPTIGRRFINIQMWTSLSEVPNGWPDFAVRRIQIRASAMVD